jgi:maltose O-acetyltransferase
LQKVRAARTQRRWRALRELGLRVGKGSTLPESIWIDTSCCYAIEIGDDVGFGPECLLLGHDAQMKHLIGAARVARIVVHDGCRIGARCVILPGVEIGPRTIVFAGSVVSRSLPPDSICAGSPARPIGTLQGYIDLHGEKLAAAPTFPYAQYGEFGLTPERRAELVSALQHGEIYLTGERTMDGPGADLPV